jgi:hypothetical protein
MPIMIARFRLNCSCPSKNLILPIRINSSTCMRVVSISVNSGRTILGLMSVSISRQTKSKRPMISVAPLIITPTPSLSLTPNAKTNFLTTHSPQLSIAFLSKIFTEVHLINHSASILPSHALIHSIQPIPAQSMHWSAQKRIKRKLKKLHPKPYHNNLFPMHFPPEIN